MAASGGIWAPAAQRFLRVAVSKGVRLMRNKLDSASRTLQAEFHHATIRSSPTGRQPIHPAALLRQQKRGAKWSSTSTYQNLNSTLRRWMSSGTTGQAAPRFNRASFPSSATSRCVGQLTGRSPFASTLRPNLTGGAMPRTQGGYSTGGGARYFSHTPAAPAQVVHNVSVAMRAFFLSGQKARFDGVNARGEKRYKSVSAMEQEAHLRMANMPRSAPGSFIDFQLSPTVTALSPLAPAFAFPTSSAHDAAPVTLHDEGFMDVLSVDLARALKDLATIFADLKKLSTLGDLPIVLAKPSVLRVRFPGVDAGTVERLCDDVGIQLGMVGEDPDFDSSAGVPVALKFPFAPDAEPEKTITSPGGSLRSLTGFEVEDAYVEEFADNPWLSDPEGYGTMSPPISSGERCSADFEGLEGIYRFLEECDRAKGRY